MKMNRCARCMEEITGDICSHCGLDNRETEQTACGLKLFTILRGRYLTGYVLGQGGFGITYIGYDLTLDKKVAVKEYYPKHLCFRDASQGNKVNWSIPPSAREQEYDRFLREARRMAKLDEIPGIVRVRDTFLENETAYIVMDFVDGITLKEELEQHGVMSYQRCYELFLPVMKSLGKLHSEGLIHRDISPDNIMLRKDGKVFLLDMGSSKDMTLGANLSQVVVKTGFSPVEQYGVGGEIGTWSDVYALCATIYYCITGKAVRRERQGGNGGLQWDEELSKTLPPEVKETLKRGLAVLYQDRIQTVEELLAALPKPEQKAEEAAERKKEEAEKKTAKEKKGLPGVKIAGIVLAAVIGISLPVYFFVRRPSSEPEVQLASNQIDQSGQADQLNGSEQIEEPADNIPESETQQSETTKAETAKNIEPETWTDSSGNKYTGRKVDGVINGFGTVEDADGQRYEGDFKKGTYHGIGTLYENDSISKNGFWEDGEYKGETETWTDSSDIKYTGLKADGVIDGYGIQEFADGVVYRGEFENGKRNGTGTMYYVDGSYYEGEYENGERNGTGTYQFVGGERYEGGFKDGKLNGTGTMYYTDGSRYEGEWKDNKKNGTGTIYYADESYYEGEWKDGERNGTGTYQFVGGECYEGEWKDGKMNGIGTMYYTDGSRYEGEWKDNKKNGTGTMYYKDGTSTTGTWDDSEVQEEAS